MKKVRYTVICLVLLGIIAACTLSGCGDEEEAPAGGGTETSQPAPADPNA